MEAVIEKEVSVRIFDNAFSQTGKNKRRSKMSETAGKIARTGIMISFLFICTLSVLLFFTRSIFIIKILLMFGVIFLLASLAILVLEITGFYKILKLSNPTNIRAGDLTTVLAVISVFCLAVPTIYGMLFIPEFISSIQELISSQQIFISSQQESMGKALGILEELKEASLSTPPAH